MRKTIFILFLALMFGGCRQAPDTSGDSSAGSGDSREGSSASPVFSPSANAPASPPLVTAARGQVGVTTIYDPAYVRLDYPGGDVPRERGVCTDVVIRALRKAKEIDLQKLVHEDMRRAFAAYPQRWGLRKPDKNIDHRRVPNLRTFFKRRGWGLPVTQNPADYCPGDLVTCTVGRSSPHIMIVSDRKTSGGRPMVIHNIGRGTQEEDALFTYPLTGHYRIPH